MQTALGFFHRRLRVVADFDFCYSGTALQRQHGDGRARQVQQIQRHAVALHYLDLDQRFRVPLARHEPTNAVRGASALGHATN